VNRGLSETVRRLRRRRRRAVSVAVDGTGLSYNSVSTFFIRRMEQHADRSPRHRHWLKWVIVVDVQQQILLAQRAHRGPGSDVRYLPGLLDVAARGAPIRVVLADAEFDSEPNHQHIRQRLGLEASSPPSAGGSPMAPFAIRCTAPSRKNRTGNAPRSKLSFRSSNVNSPRVPLGVAWPPRFAKPSSSASPIISIA